MTNLRSEVIEYEKALTTITLWVFACSTKSSVYQITLSGYKCVCVVGGGGYATIIMDVQSLVYVVMVITLIYYYVLVSK